MKGENHWNCINCPTPASYPCDYLTPVARPCDRHTPAFRPCDCDCPTPAFHPCNPPTPAFHSCDCPTPTTRPYCPAPASISWGVYFSLCVFIPSPFAGTNPDLPKNLYWQVFISLNLNICWLRYSVFYFFSNVYTSVFSIYFTYLFVYLSVFFLFIFFLPPAVFTVIDRASQKAVAFVQRSANLSEAWAPWNSPVRLETNFQKTTHLLLFVYFSFSLIFLYLLFV